jgi:phosphatidylserine synthase
MLDAEATRPSSGRPARFLHLKDLFTLVNLVSGVVAVHFVLVGEPRTAGFAVLVGFLFGDLLDGQVARRTGTANRFGSELDSIVDHFVHVVVPSLILYTVFRDAGHEVLGIVGLGVLVGTATVRHARFAADRFDFPLCWCGLPRTISGFTAMSLALAKITTDDLDGSYLPSFLLVVLLSALNLVPIPYMTHRGARAMQPWAKGLVALFLTATVAVFVFARDRTFDVFLVFMVGYALLGWVPVRREERRAFYEEYRRWSAALAH